MKDCTVSGNTTAGVQLVRTATVAATATATATATVADGCMEEGANRLV